MASNDEEWETLFSTVPKTQAPSGEGGDASALASLQFQIPPFTPTRQLTGNVSVVSGSPQAPTEQTTVREMPFDGWLASVSVEWEQGTNQLVGFQLRPGGPNRPLAPLIPDNPGDDFVSLNDSERTFWLWLPAAKGQPLTVTVQNQDDEGHSIPFIMNTVKLTSILGDALPDALLPPAEPIQAPESDDE